MKQAAGPISVPYILCSSKIHRGIEHLIHVPISTKKKRGEKRGVSMAKETEDDLLLKSFMAEVSEVERDNEVKR